MSPKRRTFLSLVFACISSYFASKILASKTPLHLGVSDDLPWGGYGLFLELRIMHPIHVCLSIDDHKIPSFH